MNTIKSGKFLLDLRKEKSLSQKEVADIIGVSDKTISKWECGEGFPSIDFLVKLSEFYEVTIDEIVKGERIVKEEQVAINKKEEKIIFNLPYFTISSLSFGLIGLLIFILVMYLGKSLTGSTITLLIFGIIQFILMIFALNKEDNKKYFTYHTPLILFSFFNLYLSLYSLGALLMTVNLSTEIYLSGIGLLLAILECLPLFGLLTYSLFNIRKNERSYKEMVSQNFQKYIDVLTFSLSLASLLHLAFSHYEVKEAVYYYVLLSLLGIVMIISLIDFVIKKEIPFLLPTIILIASFAGLMINTADYFIPEINGLGVIAIVAYICYAIIFVSKNKLKNIKCNN